MNFDRVYTLGCQPVPCADEMDKRLLHIDMLRFRRIRSASASSVPSATPQSIEHAWNEHVL